MKRQQQKSATPAVRKAAPATPKSPASSAMETTTKAKATAAKSSAPRKTKPAIKSAASPSPTKHPVPDLYSSIHALLHTMRLIERHEEPLCSMHDELKRTGKLSAAHHRKLQQLVHELPAHDYQADLETLRYALAAQNL